MNRTLFLILLTWLLAECLINPIGEFPLNDDWAFSRAVFELYQNHRLLLSDWIGVPFLSQLGWGYLASLLWGFSFTALRITTLLFAAGGIIIFHQLLDGVFKHKAIASWGTIFLAFNPLYLQLGNTFMTDVPFLVLCLSAFLILMRFQQSGKTSLLLAGTLLCVFASLSRHSGIVVTIGFGASWLLLNRFSIRNLLTAGLPFAAVAICLLTYQFALSATGLLSTSYNYQAGVLLHSLSHPSLELLRKISYYTLNSASGLGLFVLPLSASLAWMRFRAMAREQHMDKLRTYGFAAVTGMLLVIGKIGLTGKFLPFTGNAIYHLGLGPVIMTGAVSSDAEPISMLAKIGWFGLAVAGLLSVFFLLRPFGKYLMLRRLRAALPLPLAFPLLFMLVSGLVYYLPLSQVYVPDRYLLFLLPLMIMLLAAGRMKDVDVHYFNTGFPRLALMCLTGLFIYFSLAATRDYIELNRCRWKALRFLTEEKEIPANRIDGGFEFNAWYLHNKAAYRPDHNYRWWWIDRDDYMVTLKPINGFKVIEVFPYRSWLRFRTEEVLVLQKLPQQAGLEAF